MDPSQGQGTSQNKNGLINTLLWFAFLTLGFFLLLYYILKPSGLQVKDAAGSATGVMDTSKTLIVSLAIAFFIILLIYILKTWSHDRHEHQETQSNLLTGSPTGSPARSARNSPTN